VIWTGLIAAAWIALATRVAVSDFAVVSTETGDVLFGFPTAATILPSAPSTRQIPRSAPMTTRSLGIRMGLPDRNADILLVAGEHSLSPYEASVPPACRSTGDDWACHNADKRRLPR